MTVAELKTMLDAAFERGINPDTVVVIDMLALADPTNVTWSIVDSAHDPTIDKDGYVWFTLTPSDIEADSRFTPCHVND